MSEDRTDQDTDRTFHAAEQTGLKLAIKGRLITLLFVGLWLVPSRGADRALDIIGALLVLAALGVAHYLIIVSGRDRAWVKYLFFGIDTLILSVAVAVVPPEPRFDLPQIYMFRFDVFLYYFVILGVAAFSFSPGLVMFVGGLGAAGWFGSFNWVRAGMTDPLEWADALVDGTKEQFVSVILSENFAGTGSRLQESLIFLVVAMLIAGVMYRARQTVRNQLAAERDRAAVSQIFGRFVPEAIATAMIEDKGTLDPVERQATVLFIDIAGFTQLMNAKGPRDTVEIVNAYFDAATGIISRHGGVVTQFQGDGILAVFNVPVENEAHAQCAFAAASEILATVRDSRFAGQQMAVRIGLNSGPVIAGNVGGGGRQSYTVYGDTVNLAARLEALNKQYGTSLLVSHSAATQLTGADLTPIGKASIRGFPAPVDIYTLAQP